MSLFAFGLGFCASRVIGRGRLAPAGGTARSGLETWRARGVEAYLFDGESAGEGLLAALPRFEIGLVSIPPGALGDPTLRILAPALRTAGWRRIVYLSTVGVYGDSGGAWVDETSPTQPVSVRARARVEAEAAWRAFGREAGVAVDILRLGGIYGPGRSAFDRLRDGAPNAVKPGQVFNRIHVDDIAAAIETVVARGGEGAIYNVVDGSPSPPQEAIACAAELAGVPPPPPQTPYRSAGLSAMGLSFFEENRRVRNESLRALGWAPVYPTYREGLAAILAEAAPA